MAVGGFVIDDLEQANGESGGFSCSGLGLGHSISLADDGQDSPLLNDGRLLETETVNSSEKVRVQVELLKGVDSLKPDCLFDLNLLFLTFLHILLWRS